MPISVYVSGDIFDDAVFIYKLVSEHSLLSFGLFSEINLCNQPFTKTKYCLESNSVFFWRGE